MIAITKKTDKGYCIKKKIKAILKGDSIGSLLMVLNMFQAFLVNGLTIALP